MLVNLSEFVYDSGVMIILSLFSVVFWGIWKKGFGVSAKLFCNLSIFQKTNGFLVTLFRSELI